MRPVFHPRFVAAEDQRAEALGPLGEAELLMADDGVGQRRLDPRRGRIIGLGLLIRLDEPRLRARARRAVAKPHRAHRLANVAYKFRPNQVFKDRDHVRLRPPARRIAPLNINSGDMPAIARPAQKCTQFCA